MDDLQNPSSRCAAVTPSDTVDLTETTRAIYIGGAGAVSLLPRGGEGTAVVFSGIPAGFILPVRTRRIRSTGTTATLIVALF